MGEWIPGLNKFLRGSVERIHLRNKGRWKEIDGTSVHADAAWQWGCDADREWLGKIKKRN